MNSDEDTTIKVLRETLAREREAHEQEVQILKREIEDWKLVAKEIITLGKSCDDLTKELADVMRQEIKKER